MALPKTADLDTLDYDFDGEPFTQVGANGSVNTQTLDYDFDGVPFVAASANSNFTQSLSYTETLSPSLSKTAELIKTYTETLSYSLAKGFEYFRSFSYTETLTASMGNLLTKLNKLYTETLTYSITKSVGAIKTYIETLVDFIGIGYFRSFLYSLSQIASIQLAFVYAKILSFSEPLNASIILNFIHSVILPYTQSFSVSHLINTIKLRVIIFLPFSTFIPNHAIGKTFQFISTGIAGINNVYPLLITWLSTLVFTAGKSIFKSFVSTSTHLYLVGKARLLTMTGNGRIRMARGSGRIRETKE